MQLICGIRWFDGRSASRDTIAGMVRAMLPAAAVHDLSVIVDGPLAMTAVEMHPRGPVRPAGSLIEKPSLLLAADVQLYGAGRSERNGRRAAGVIAERLTRDSGAGLATLSGDFALAHWNRAAGTLMLARDHFGARPLQYVLRPGAYLAFASLPSALIATGLAGTDLDEAVIASYPVNGFAPRERTYFKDVKSVEAAHTVEIDSRQDVTTRRYWRVSTTETLRFDKPQDEAARELRQLLEQAVARRLPDDGPAGGHCSGGLDSTSISVVAARLLRGANRTYHAFSFQEDARTEAPRVIDEASYVADVAAQQPNMRVSVINSHGMFDILKGGIDPYTLLPSASFEPEHLVLTRAAEEGVGVLFSGWGGDQAVTSAGRGAEVELFRSGAWRLLKRQITALARLNSRSHARTFFNYVVLPSLPRRLRSAYLSARGLSTGPRAPFEFIAEGFRRRPFYETQPLSPDSRINRRTWLEYSWISKRLEMFAQLGAPYGISYTYPLLDLDVITYAMTLPGLYYCRDGVPRSLIRDATAGLLPERVRLRQEKLTPFPRETFRLAEQRDEIVDALKTLEREPIVSRYLDVANIIAYQEQGSTPESIEAEMQNAHGAGRQFSNFEEQHDRALLMAMYLANNRPKVRA